MSPARRSEPLRARPPGPGSVTGTTPPAGETRAAPAVVGHNGSANGHAGGRFRRLAEGVRRIRVGGGTLNLNERTLMVLGGILGPVGLVLVVLGWYGAAHTPYLFEQVPYLISGGLLGLGLVFLGAFFYFAHWLTELVKEHRAQSAAVIEAIARLEETVRAVGGAGAAAGTDGRAGAGAEERSSAVVLVATQRGTMAHRPDCVVVAGKDDLRPVDPDDGLLPCKLCDPYAEAPAGG